MIVQWRNYLLLLIGIFILIANQTQAQRVQPNRWFLSADGGISVFFGDVKRYEYIPDYESPSEIQPMFSGSLGKEISPVFSLRAQVLYGELSGHKKSARYNFTSTLLGGHVMTDINLIYLFTGARFGSTRLHVITSLGAGYMTWDSELCYDTPLKDGEEIMAQSFSGDLSFPGSLSFEYVLSKNLSVNAQGMLYVIASDEVDAKVGGIKIDMVNYNSLGLVYKISAPKRKAKRSKIKYALDPALYEPKKEEQAQEELVEESPGQDVIKETQQILPEEKEAIVIEEPKENQIDHTLEKKAINKEAWTPSTEEAWPDMEFSVQILATKTPQKIDKLQNQYKIAEKISEKYDGEWYRYNVGQYDKLWKAKETRNILRSDVGIEGAFIVVYKNQQKISLAQALNESAREPVKIAKEEQIQEENAPTVYPLVKLSNSIPSEGYFVGIQVLALKSDFYPMGVFKGVYDISNPIIVYEHMPWNKIIIGGFDSYEEAENYQKIARSKGFIDAFIVIFKDGKRISLKRYLQDFRK